MRLANHGHEHHSMKPVLKHFGATWVPDVTFQHWVAMRCPFHEDNSASAQTDGVAFRCFTCDVYYPFPMKLLMEREGLSFSDAHDKYHKLVGAGDGPVRTVGQRSFALSGSTRHRSSGRRKRQAGRRS